MGLLTMPIHEGSGCHQCKGTSYVAVLDTETPDYSLEAAFVECVACMFP